VTARDRLTLWGIGALGAAGLMAGMMAGPYPSLGTTIPEPSAPVTVSAALPCAAFTDGAPAGTYIGGACYTSTTTDGAPTLDTADYGTDIPRCASDDWNSTHLPVCYTEAPGVIIVIDQDDNTVAELR
jgi:hypothetical protein